MSYKVYRDGVVIAQPTATTFTDTGLENGRQYRYEVSQVINGVESSHSAAVLATPVAAVPPPPPPPPDVPPPPPPVAGTHVPTSIDGTGTADVASALKSWLQGLPNGATALLDGKTFRCDGGLHLEGRGPITIRDGTIWQKTRGSSPILLCDYGSDGIILRNMTIRGSNPTPGLWVYAYEHNHGIALSGARNCEVDSCHVVNVGGDGYYAAGAWQPGGSFRFSDNVHIHNSTFSGIGRMGIAATDGANNVHVDHCSFDHIGYYTCDIEPNGHVFNGVAAGATGFKFNDNTIGTIPFGRNTQPGTPPGISGQATGHVFVITGASGGGPGDDVEIARNVMSDPNWGYFSVGVYNNGGLRRNIRVIDDRGVRRMPGPQMVFQGVNGLTVTGNTQPLSSGSLVSDTGGSGTHVTSPNTTA